MKTPAWRALPSSAQALYVWLKLEWRGPNNNNNGKLFLSVRQSAEVMGLNPKTTMRAFQELQAKGFIEVTEGASIGMHGMGKSHHFLITEIETTQGGNRVPAKMSFRNWREGHDFPVVKLSSASRKNPSPKNGTQIS